ncbi:TPA: hypothetical protein MAO97_000831 [Klebsiella pneumoniae]|uniref:OB-fold protein n=1 Tax=Klebsiella variicola TaxID=244366 RepID=UPI000D744A37|nr:hypothetical protein [Klebsiella variicola]PXH38238.1 hypothetical protein DMR27_19295 [Klebsiella variicola]HBS7154808.1 hypothetical protein [Klebsiella pneumoniae]
MRQIIVLSLMFCSFTSVAEKQQPPISGNLQPYRNSAEDYISNLFSSTCELALKGGINANIPIDQSTKGLIAQATQGMKKDTSAYATIHDTAMLGAAVGLKIKAEGKTITQDKTEIHTCGEFVSYIVQNGLMSQFTAGLSAPEQSTTTKADHNVSDGSIYKTTAKELTAMYDENEVAADDKIGGRKVEVKGVVQSIDKDFTGSVVVLLQSGNDFMPARFGMEETEKPKAASLRKGQTVSIICEKMMFLIGSPSGSRCRFN